MIIDHVNLSGRAQDVTVIFIYDLFVQELEMLQKKCNVPEDGLEQKVKTNSLAKAVILTWRYTFGARRYKVKTEGSFKQTFKKCAYEHTFA